MAQREWIMGIEQERVKVEKRKKEEREKELNCEVKEDNRRARDASLLEKANRKRLNYAEMPVELRSDVQRRIAKCDCDDKDDNLARKRKSFRRCKIKTAKRLASLAQEDCNQRLSAHKLLSFCKIDESKAISFPPPPPPRLTRRQRRDHPQRPLPVSLEELTDRVHEF